MVKKNKRFLLFPCILLLLNSCSGICKLYRVPNSSYSEGSTDLGPISTSAQFLSHGFLFPFGYLQPVLPLPYENYDICFTVSNINDALKNAAERENEEYTDDIMISMYIDEFRIVLPSGNIIDLLKGKIDITYHYNGSEKEAGMLYKKEQNIKPQNIDGVKKIFFDGIKDGDGISIYFYAKIPAYFVNSISLEYTLTIEWKNRGTVKRRYVGIFNKEVHKWYAFTT